MEISKGLQEEIILVQNKLKNAIRDHQICVGRLKDEPNNSDILGKIQEIQLHIVSLGRCQKQIVERLRKEVEVYRAENANGGKVSLAALLGLNNNNHITTYNDKKDEVKVQANGIDVRRSSRDNYDDFGRNGGVSGRRNLCAKERSSSVETLSADEDVIEVSNDENSTERQSETSEIEASVMEDDQSNVKQVNFLSNLGLITTGQLCELQNKKTERKRRSTANPQFVYPNWDLPSKRKRHAYLQSVGTAPQTRQTTARLNGPSPPPVKAPPKSTSPPTKTISKNSIPQQKSAVRPNILRTMQETRASQNRSKLDNGTSQREAKVVETKSVHIPGLPSSLTIERIENDTAVCINCRNPGTLTMCDTCSANYHISCHTISPPPPRQCPKCVQKKKEEERSTPIIKKDDELAAASYAPGVAGKAGEDPEINKAPRGLHKIDATVQRQVPSSAISQLPTSTLLIPITPSPLTSTNPHSKMPPLAITSHVTYTPLGINTFSNHHQGITYIKSNTTASHSPHTTEQQYLIVKKLPAPEAQPIVPKNISKIGNINAEPSNLAQSSPLLFDKLSRGTKKPLPGLNPISSSSNDMESSHITEKSCSPVSRDKSDANYPFAPSNSPNGSDSVIEPRVRINAESDPPIAIITFTPSSRQSESSNTSTASTDTSKSSDLHNSVLTGNNKSDIIANCIDESSRHDLRRQTSIAHRLARRLSEDRAAHHRSRQSTTKFAEYLKLEEAHLSAPLAANLGLRFEGLERPKSCSSVEGLEPDGGRIKPRILMRERRSLDSLDSANDPSKGEVNWRKGDDVWLEDRQKKERIPAGNDIELFDESTMSASEDEKTGFRDDDDDGDRVSIVSSIDMQVLEDFETALKQIEGGTGQTAN
ncbi:mucin-2-like isoform X1 [Diachasmimorpha longicaudata]|uniref:mucin-2-like isoform X1 n=1 Tax=Diachasmimorpha longicaudata TaxID=58733 RepID=UPI0030B87228